MGIQDLFRKSKQEWLDGARTKAIQLLRNRTSVTIEDVLEQYPFPKYLHRNTIGSVFQDRRFTAVGYTGSRRSVSHGRTIRQWSLSDYYAKTIEQDCDE